MPALNVDGVVQKAKIGEAAPDFDLYREDGGIWRLSEQLGRVTVLLFYPQNETLVCTKQLCSLRDNWADYLETKAEIVGISPGLPDDNKQFSGKRRLPMSLLSDPGRVITRKFGEHWLYPIAFTRAVVVIDAKGIVRSRDIMLRAFRPSDEKIITDIYSARGDALNDVYNGLKKRVAAPSTLNEIP